MTTQIIDVACLEIEVSLWSYEDDIQGALAAAAKHRIPVLAYSPLGRGFITRKFKTPEDIPEGSFQRHVPRFQGEAFYKNLELVDKLDEAAERKGVSTSALALAWVAGLNEMVSAGVGKRGIARACLGKERKQG
jgi:pyridoxine 4-dehydrogenase